MGNSIGETIRQLRVIRGLSQENVAEEIDMSNGNYGKIERGEIDINTTLLVTLSKVLKVKVSDFFNQPQILREPGNEYEFANKNDFEQLMKMIKKLSEDIEALKNNPRSKNKSKAYKKNISRKKKYN